jgi:hypothetical protein
VVIRLASTDVVWTAGLQGNLAVDYREALLATPTIPVDLRLSIRLVAYAPDTIADSATDGR